MRRQYALRSMTLIAGFGLVALAVLVQMIRIQNSEQAAIFLSQGDQYAGEFRMFYPERGEIYDRNGHLLAGNRTVYEVGVSLSEMEDPDALAFTLGTYLGLTYEEVFKKLTESPESWSYVVIQDYVDANIVAALQEQIKQLETAKDFRLQGIAFKPHFQRSYPETSLASNVLGFVTRDGRGYFGIEEKYNDLLAGNPVQVWVPRDPNKATEIPRVPNGTTLVLTLNRDLQARVESILDEALIEYGAQNGAIVVMDPRNGEILAMSTTPRMDLNKYTNYFSLYNDGSQYNRSIGTAYEPGSVMKVLTMAAALDMGLVKPETTYVDTGSIQVGGFTIQNWDKEAWGEQNMVGCLQHSLNVCMAWISTQMGPTAFYGYMERFGFGHPTGVDLAGEAMGRLKTPGDSDWYNVDLGTNAFGQGVTATPLQMLMAASAIANDGKMVTPHILYSMLRDGHQYNVPSQYGGSPITAQTAHTLSEMLAQSLNAESSEALLSGYRVAGKTGTAQIPTEFGYDPSVTNASFIGWGPVDDPQFMIYVWLNAPTSSIWGSQTAAPTFSKVAEQTVILLNIPPDNVRFQLTSK
ncbi:MAG TPA: penicillin-binding protein 2 [Anaerolineales bacterium]|nr:penicillin-binding protein 2 [Anaerolineales bacterium]HMR99566.1 penicillin-binding protein 2 [Anaerolineales bacterium]HNQ95323.1 penicillin-binding protein 2 [Anaerolineales bacterium]HNS61738.1 penicillin-binding protein 2 [Anaerolineales bacterium]